MNFSPSVFDLALIIIATAAFAVEPVVLPFVKAKIEAGSPTARLRSYQWEIVVLCGACAAVIVLWSALGRPWSALYFGQAESWRLLIGFALAAIIAFLNFRDRRVLLTRPDVLAKYRHHIEKLEFLMPRSATEARWWTAMSLTAGVTEEILCRGFLLALVAHFTGVMLAAPIAAVIFGLGHAYQGSEGIVRTTLFGLIATIIVLVSGSLLPAILLHVVIDLVAGDLGRRIATASDAA
jgi:membrane protease YdiL (CAAX protease family)